MTTSNSPLAYEDCYAVMDAAIGDPQGARMRMPTLDAAIHFRMRCHQARKIDREKNAETYEKHDPRHGVSVYDRLSLKIARDSTGIWLILKMTTAIPGEVVSLSTGEVLETTMPQAAPALPPPEPPVDLGEAFDAIEAIEVEPQPRLPSPSGFRRV